MWTCHDDSCQWRSPSWYSWIFSISRCLLQGTAHLWCRVLLVRRNYVLQKSDIQLCNQFSRVACADNHTKHEVELKGHVIWNDMRRIGGGRIFIKQFRAVVHMETASCGLREHGRAKWGPSVHQDWSSRQRARVLAAGVGKGEENKRKHVRWGSQWAQAYSFHDLW